MKPEQQILRLAKHRGVLRARDLAPLHLPRRHLSEMVAKGTLHKSARGLYVPASADLTEHHTLVEACARVPVGIICLLSALRFHNITLQNPSEVWLAITIDSRKPKTDYPPLRIARFSGDAYTQGVEHHTIEGVDVRVYNVAKTIADCFKYRHKIGIDVALEALRRAWAGKRVSSDEIWHFAQVCRVTNVMRPYLDTLE
jgi:predicted transcriptional regulator of viral defense system